MTVYVKNLGDTGRRVKFKSKQGRWSKLLWKKGSLLCSCRITLMLDSLAAVLEILWMLNNVSQASCSCSYWEWGEHGQPWFCFE